MPHGSSPGERRGGRVAGTPNRATAEALEAERIHEQMAMKPEEAARRAPGAADELARVLRSPTRMLAKERGEELLELAIGCAAYFQPTFKKKKGEPDPNENADWQQFKEWFKIADAVWAKLAHFQSPTYRAIVVTTPGEMSGPAPAPAPEQFFDEGEDAATRAQQAYLRLVKG